MATVTKAASSNTVVTTGWTNPTNAYGTSADGVLATATPGKNATVNSDYGFAAFTTSDIPAGSTINSVTVHVGWKLSATGVTGETLGVQIRNGATALGTETTDTASTTTTDKTQVVTSGIAQADLQSAGTVVARVRCSKGNTSTALTGSLDYVYLVVDYTPPGNWTLIAGVSDVSSGGVTPVTSRAQTLSGAVATGDAIFVNVQRAAAANDLSGDTLTDNLGNTYTLLDTGWDSTNHQGYETWYTIVTAAGTPTITSSDDGVTTHLYWSIQAQAYRSALGTAGLDSHAGHTTPITTSGTAADNITGPSVTPSVDTCLIVAGSNDTSDAATFTAGTNYTKDQDSGVTAGSDAAVEHREMGTSTAGIATTPTGTGSLSGSKWMMGVAVFSPSAGATKTISGAPSGVATVSASVVRTRAVSASISGTATVSASVVRTRAIAPSSSGVATVSGSVVRTRAIAPSSSGAATVSASVVRTRALSPTVNGVATVTAALAGFRSIAAAINGVATVTTGIARTRPIAGTANGVASVSASITGTGQATAVDNETDSWISHFYY